MSTNNEDHHTIQRWWEYASLEKNDAADAILPVDISCTIQRAYEVYYDINFDLQAFHLCIRELSTQCINDNPLLYYDMHE